MHDNFPLECAEFCCIMLGPVANFKVVVANLPESVFLCNQGIIEGDQIEVAAFYLESFAYLTGLVTADHKFIFIYF